MKRSDFSGGLSAGATLVDTGICRIRRWSRNDLERLPVIANDIRVARFLRHHFPHPYTKADAADWLDRVTAESNITRFAIDANGVLAGGIAVQPLAAEHAGVADFGYWLGFDFWGRGIATSAARAFVPYVFKTFDVRRLEAPMMAANLASARVLEKAGFLCECELADWYVDREGTIHDGIMYRMNRSEYDRLPLRPTALSP